MSPPHIARYLIVIIAGRVTHEYATPIQRFAIRPETGRVCTVVPSARVAKLADAPDLGSGVHGRGGSSPPSRTTGTRSPSSMTRIRRSARLAHQVRSPTGFVCEPPTQPPIHGVLRPGNIAAATRSAATHCGKLSSSHCADEARKVSESRQAERVDRLEAFARPESTRLRNADHRPAHRGINRLRRQDPVTHGCHP